jgi:hypothetical protein
MELLTMSTDELDRAEIPQAEAGEGWRVVGAMAS